MNDHKQANIERINHLWPLHESQNEKVETEGRCLALDIEKRIVHQVAELRLGVSFGGKVVTPETEQGFLPIRRLLDCSSSGGADLSRTTTGEQDYESGPHWVSQRCAGWNVLR